PHDRTTHRDGSQRQRSGPLARPDGSASGLWRTGKSRTTAARFGLQPGRINPPGKKLFRWLAYSSEPGPGTDDAVGFIAARRTDQPPRFRSNDVARAVPEKLPGYAAVYFARPRFYRRCGQ